MNDVTDVERPPRGIRLLHALQREPDWSTMTSEELIAFRDAANRKAASRIGRVVTGLPDHGAAIEWQEVTLPDRAVPVRVYRPSPKYGGRDADLPLLLQVHGGGFVGTAVQCDWANSHFAAQLPAVIVSVEHRLIAPGTALSAAVDDGWDVLQHVVEHAAEWGVDPARVAVAGESTGGLIAALAAIRAKESGLPLQAQILVNPVTDLTETMFDYPSMVEHANSPTSTVAEIRFFQRLAVPSGTDPRPLSPLYADDPSGLAPALVVVPTIDPLADHGRRYAERLLESGTPAQLTEYPGATHAFLSMPGLVPQAKAARAKIAEFLRYRLACRPVSSPSTKTGQR